MYLNVYFITDYTVEPFIHRLFCTLKNRDYLNIITLQGMYTRFKHSLKNHTNEKCVCQLKHEDNVERKIILRQKSECLNRTVVLLLNN